MHDNTLQLAKAITVFLGNTPVEVPAGAVITFPTLSTRDEVAEALAQNQKAYGENRDVLAHEIVRPHVFVEGEAARPARVSVTYGLHGARVEGVPAEVKDEEPPVPDGQPELAPQSADEVAALAASEKANAGGGSKPEGE